MASSVWAFSRHATFPRRFPGHSQTAEVNRVRMDFPSYPVDIVLPSFNHADTAHIKLLCADVPSESEEYARDFVALTGSISGRAPAVANGT